MHEIEEFDKALRTSLALLAARGDRELLNKDHYTFSRPARSRFNQEVDRLFFPSLWRRVAAAADPTASRRRRTNFLAELHQAAQAEFDSALPDDPVHGHSSSPSRSEGAAAIPQFIVAIVSGTIRKGG